MPYLTPDIEALESSPSCRTIAVGGELWYLVTGALDELSKAYRWEQHGTATPEDMVEYFMDVLDSYNESSCGESGMQYLYPVQQIVNTDESEGITSWVFPVASLPENASALLLGVQITPTGDGTFTGGALRSSPGLGGASVVSYTIANGWFQFVCPVGVNGINIKITGGGLSWTITVNVIGYW